MIVVGSVNFRVQSVRGKKGASGDTGYLPECLAHPRGVRRGVVCHPAGYDPLQARIVHKRPDRIRPPPDLPETPLDRIPRPPQPSLWLRHVRKRQPLIHADLATYVECV
jgi:hypothetical protein